VRVYYNLKDFNALRPVVTIGTFDGVHLGHRKIIGRLKEIASEIKGESVIFTFNPHPRQIVSAEEHNLRLLNTLSEKIELLRDAEIDHLIIYPFTAGFSAMSYVDFVKEVLVEQIHTACLVVGYDHQFGQNRKGNYEYLQKCSRQYNFTIERLDVLLVDEINVSSTHIRRALESGDITLANKYLGYPYELHGIVVEGRHLGRKIGFPTANIEANEVAKLIPGYGVYAVYVKVRGILYKGMLNIGTRPTFTQNADARSIEVNIFDFDDSIYQEEISVLFIEKIRNEQKFPSKEALIDQLFLDKITALKLLT
jgi:riboflavin kinase / FMN adenylyltransferase